ncbi:MAG TPA: DUF4349 domain-containing protein [Kineosporiaceae bacterium]
MSRPRRIVAIPLLAGPLLATALALAGCGGPVSSTSGGAAGGAEHGAARNAAVPQAAVPQGGSAALAPAMAGAAAAGTPGAGAADVAKAGTGGGVALPNPAVKVVRTADVVIEVAHLDTAATRVRAIAEGTGGALSSETTSYSSKAPTPRPATNDGAATPAANVQPGESVLVLRVPAGALDQTVEQVVRVGKELWRTSSAVDVTADLADLASRVRTAQASVERVRALLARAGSLQEIVSIEAELTRRESDLEALEARQAALAGRAELSTLTVTLRTPDVTSPVAPEDDNGVVSGLERGWHAVVVSTGVVLTVLGALLPVAVVLAVIGLPLWWFLRRLGGRRTSAAPMGTAPGPGLARATAQVPAPQLVGAGAPAAPAATATTAPATASSPSSGPSASPSLGPDQDPGARP